MEWEVGSGKGRRQSGRERVEEGSSYVCGSLIVVDGVPCDSPGFPHDLLCGSQGG